MNNQRLFNNPVQGLQIRILAEQVIAAGGIVEQNEGSMRWTLDVSALEALEAILTACDEQHGVPAESVEALATSLDDLAKGLRDSAAGMRGAIQPIARSNAGVMSTADWRYATVSALEYLVAGDNEQARSMLTSALRGSEAVARQRMTASAQTVTNSHSGDDAAAEDARPAFTSAPNPPAEVQILMVEVPGQLHGDTADLVRRFAVALGEKLTRAQLKYGFDNAWSQSDWMDECRMEFLRHVAKGDPIDVAAYAAFLWHHGQRTALPGGHAKVVGWMYEDSSLAPCRGTPNSADYAYADEAGLRLQLLYTVEHPPRQELFYVQDTRSYVGNCPTWFRDRGCGYTTRLDEAARFTLDQAASMHRSRKTNLPWPCEVVDERQRPTVDIQHLGDTSQQEKRFAAGLTPLAPSFKGEALKPTHSNPAPSLDDAYGQTSE